MCRYVKKAEELYGAKALEEGLPFSKIAKVLSEIEGESFSKGAAANVFSSGVNKLKRVRGRIDNSLDLFHTEYNL